MQGSTLGVPGSSGRRGGGRVALRGPHGGQQRSRCLFIPHTLSRHHGSTHELGRLVGCVWGCLYELPTHTGLVRCHLPQDPPPSGSLQRSHHQHCGPSVCQGPSPPCPGLQGHPQWLPGDLRPRQVVRDPHSPDPKQEESPLEDAGASQASRTTTWDRRQWLGYTARLRQAQEPAQRS